jgi:hypothetical protein
MSGAKPGNREAIQKHKETCMKILSLNPRIRYVGMLNKFGKTLAGAVRKDMKPLFKPEEAMEEFFITAAGMMLRKSFTNSLGRHNFTLTIHEKVKIVTFASDTVTFYITVDKDTSYEEIAKIVEGASKFTA